MWAYQMDRLSMPIWRIPLQNNLHSLEKKTTKNGVLRKLKHIFPNTYQRIKSIRSPAKGGTGCYRFNYQPGS